jgi:hypothetical protein
MYSVEHDDAGEGHIIHTTLSRADAAYLRDHSSWCVLKITIGDVDLPAYVSDGKLYIQAPLGHILEAFASDLSAIIRDLEIRVSGAGGSTFSLDSDGRPVHGETVAFASVVRSVRDKR